MILDQLSHADSYGHLGPLFEKGFAYLKNFSPETPDGKHEIEGERLFALVQTYETAPASERQFEAHRRYADIQYIVEGREAIYYNDVSVLKAKAEYDAGKDVTFYHDRDDRPVFLGEGDFVVLWPHDAHKPSCDWDGAVKMRKVVLKVLL